MRRRLRLLRLSGVVCGLGCLAWLAGCGGGPKTDLAKTEPLAQEQMTLAPVASDESLAKEFERQTPGGALRQERHPRLGPGSGRRG